MQLFGAGRRASAATLLVTMALGAAGTSQAAWREDKHESASTVVKPGSGAERRASTKSVASRDGNAAFGKGDFYPNITDWTEPTEEEALLVDLVNIERTTRGLKPLRWDPLLTRLARIHADDMRATRKTSHNSSKDGADYGTRLSRTPYRTRTAAENVAFNNTVVKAHRALMASPGHRRNILDPKLTALGTGILREQGGSWLYVVQDFATPIASVSDDEAEQKLRDSLTRGRSIVEDKSLSKKLDGMLEDMIKHGKVQQVNVHGEGQGWSLAFTSLDPASAPKSAMEQAGKAQAYALAVSFRKTAKYPLGAYWAILFFKGQY